MEISKPAAVGHSRTLWIAGVILSFFCGMAVTNGYVTENAVHSAVSSVQGDCNWTLKRELWLQRNRLQRRQGMSQTSPVNPPVQ